MKVPNDGQVIVTTNGCGSVTNELTRDLADILSMNG